MANSGHRPANGPQRPVECELAETERGDVHAQLPAGAEDPEGDRKLEPGPLLAALRRREIHRDPAQRKLESGVPHGGANALASFLHRGVRETHDHQRRQAIRDVDFHGYERRLETPQRAGGDARDSPRGRWPVRRRDRDGGEGCAEAASNAIGRPSGTAVLSAPAD